MPDFHHSDVQEPFFAVLEVWLSLDDNSFVVLSEVSSDMTTG